MLTGSAPYPLTPRRIAHILPWPAVGGTETATLRIVKALRAEPFEHLVFYIREARAVAEWFQSAGVTVLPFDPVNLSGRTVLAYLRSSIRLARALRRNRIDLVHCAEVDGSYYASLAALLARLPLVCHVRNPYPALSRLQKLLLRPVRRFLFVSKNSWSEFAVNVEPSRGQLLYDCYRFAEVGDKKTEGVGDVKGELGIPPNQRIVGMVSRVAPQKDFPTLLKAARRVLAEAPQTHFLIVGDHSDSPGARAHYEHVQQLIRAEALETHVTFTGFRRDTARLVSAMDICVLSTHMEGFGLVLIEAMALGKPVIGTAVGGVPEIITDGETGLLHRHEDDKQLADQILLLLRDRVFANRLASLGHQSVMSRFSERAFGSHLTEIYNSLLTPPSLSGVPRA